MKTKTIRSHLLLLRMLNGIATASPTGTAFTCQGKLTDGANPANGVYDLRFTIYDSTNVPGTVAAGPLTNAATAVGNRLFTVTLDFGAGVFDGNARWLEIAVRTNGGGNSAGHAATVPGGYADAASGWYSFAAGQQAQALHVGSFVWADSTAGPFASTGNNQFNIRAAGGVYIQSGLGISLNAANNPPITRGWDPFTSGAYTGLGRWGLFMEPFNLAIGIPDVGGRYFQITKYEVDSSSTPLVTVDLAGNMTITGAYSPSSDRNAKTNFATVSPQEILERVAALPIQTWSYKNDPTTTRHIGPMAQDFTATFGVGADDKHIATVDADGVALAAIQGLNQKVEQKETEIAELKARLANLEALVQQLARAQVKSKIQNPKPKTEN